MDRRLSILLIVLLLIALARYVAVAFFIHPFADDLSYAVAGMRTDLLPRLWDEYHLWNGRWFSNILVLRGPLVLGIEKGLWLYRIVPIALLALTWCGLYALIRVLVDAWSLPRGSVAVLASLFLLLYLHVMPDLGEGLYWYTGAVSYQLPGALMLLLAAAWIRMIDTVKEKRTPWLVLIIVLAVIICGCNELHMVFMVMVYTALVLIPRSPWIQFRRKAVVVLGFVVVAALVMILAPGNEGRGSQFPLRHDLLHTLGWGALQTGRFLLTWITSPALLITSVLYLTLRERILEHASLLSIAVRVRPWRFALFIVAVVFVAMALPYWSTGLLGQHRTVNATLLFFLPCWFFLLTVIQLRWRPKDRRHEATPQLKRFRLFGFALLAVVFFATGSGRGVSFDLLDGRLRGFDAQLSDRYRRIEQAKQEGLAEVMLPALNMEPRSIRYLDGGADPGDWINRSIAYYFQADTMRIIIEAEPNASTGPAASP